MFAIVTILKTKFEKPKISMKFTKTISIYNWYNFWWNQFDKPPISSIHSKPHQIRLTQQIQAHNLIISRSFWTKWGQIQTN